MSGTNMNGGMGPVEFAGVNGNFSAFKGPQSTPQQTTINKDLTPNPGVITDPNKAPGSKEGPSALAEFEGMFHNGPKLDKDGKEIKEAPPEVSIFDQLNDEGYAKLAEKGFDASAFITEEVISKIQGGGADAVTALAEVLNNSTRAAMATSLKFASGISKKGMEHYSKNSTSSAVNEIKQSNAIAALEGKSELFKHPAYSANVKSVISEIIKTHPNLTESQVVEKAMNYYKQLGMNFDSKETGKDKSGNKSDFNFLDFLTNKS